MIQGRPSKLITATLALLAGCIIRAGVTVAGEYHTSQQNICSDCHVSHSSVRGQTWTPTAKLLKNSGGEVALCLSCHDGTDPRAPDIISSGTAANPSNIVATAYTSKYGSSAGFFQGDYLAAANPGGHDLRPGVTITAPLSTGYSKSGGLVCSDCHDVHGSANYRNLVPDPNPNHPGSYELVLNRQIRENTPVNTQNPNPVVAYDTANVSFYVQNNISAWCADCHDLLDQNANGTSPAHFRGHPSDVQLLGTGYHTDVANWSSPGIEAQTGFGLDVGDMSGGIPRLRYGSPTGSNTSAGSSDTVFCLSCHKAHGSKNEYGMVWPYHREGLDSYSGCQQCHFK